MARLAADGAIGSVNLDRALTSRCCLPAPCSG